MTKRLHYFSLVFLLLVMGIACNSSESNKEQILSKCSILGDEVKQYGRANYLRLFYFLNPNKFEAHYQKVANFDNAQHRAMINTYVDAIQRLKTKDESAKRLIAATKEITEFVKYFVDTDYPLAVKHRSSSNPQSDAFFMEINNIVKFDQNIKGFDAGKATFKGLLDKYNKALEHYSNKPT